jgi:hypothetical protein
VIKKFNENPNIDHFAGEKNRAEAYEKQLAVRNPNPPSPLSHAYLHTSP